MMTPPKTPWFLFLVALALSACESGAGTSVDSVYSKLVAPPAPCGGGDPTCNVATDFPTQTDLTVDNSDNIVFSGPDNAITLTPGSNLVVDLDGDGVPFSADECPGPGWRAPCDGDASDDGIYDTAYYNSDNPNTVAADVSITGTINFADAYILMDSSGSMGGEHARLLSDLSANTFGTCPGSENKGLIGAMKCSIANLWMGLGEFREIPLSPHGNPYSQTPYHHYLDLTPNTQHMLDAVSSLVAISNSDHPEATTQALYSVVTGNGLGPFVPNRAGCPPGHWGYPCFRPGALPIVILFTDAAMWNGPLPSSRNYDPNNPPFNSGLGDGALLPPVEQDSGMLYADDAFSAYDLGDLSSKSVTLMGSNARFGDDANTWNVGSCVRNSSRGYYSDGFDSFIRFSLSAPTTISVSGQNTHFPTTNVALATSGGSFVGCDNGPGGGDWWGRLNDVNLGAGSWYAIIDASVSPRSTNNKRRGPYQLRFQSTPSDPSWLTTDLPVPWSATEAALVARGVKVLTVISPSDSRAGVVQSETEALAQITGSVDQSGDPYVERIATNGSGLSTALLDAVDSLVGNTRRNITVIAEDNPATPTVDESDFVKLIEASTCPTSGFPNCLGGQGTDTCLGCLANAGVGFQFRIGNDFVPPTALPQIFEFDLVAIGDGSIELDRIPVRIMVPGDGSSYGNGFYENSYAADYVCEMPPDRPDWGNLTWVGSTPSDSTVEFEVFSGNSLEELETQIPISIVYPTDTTSQVYDIGDLLVDNGIPNYMPYLRVKAKLSASSDTYFTPIFEGWWTEFNCIPFD